MRPSKRQVTNVDRPDRMTAVQPIVINHPRSFVFLLAALSMMAPLSTDMYLPATPTIARSLGAGEAVIIDSLSTFFFGFAAGQLLWGPLSDRFGRRVPMLAGILLYIGASIACATTESGTGLVVWRFFEAFGGCAPPILAQAIVRDVYDRPQGARVLSLMQMIGAIAPMAAPSLGGVLLVWFQWRAIFWVLTGFGVVSLIAVAFVPDTWPPARRRRLPWHDLVTGYGALLGHRRYLGYALAAGFFGGSFFGYLAGSPFVFIHYYGLDPQAFALLFGVGMLGLIGSNFLNRWLVQRLDSDRVLRIGLSVAAISGLGVMLAGRHDPGGMWLLIPPLFGIVFAQGMVAANSVAGAMSDFPHRAGAAAGLIGTMRTGIGAAGALLVGWFADGTPWPTAAVIGGLAIAAFAANLVMLRHTP